MSGIAAKLRHSRDKAQGIGTNDHAQKYLNQDFESLRDDCLERGVLFEDDCFEALPSSLGYNELGPASYKVRGISWKRPTVGARYYETFVLLMLRSLTPRLCVFFLSRRAGGFTIHCFF